MQHSILRQLLPFIKANHGDGQHWFWMDLTLAHYTNDILDFLCQENVWFVPKEANTPYVASLRPVTDFWAV